MTSSSWTLALPPKLLSSATAVAAWLAVNESPSNTGQKFDRSLSAYWQAPLEGHGSAGMAGQLADAVAKQGLRSSSRSSSSRADSVTMRLLNMVKAVKLPTAGPPVVHLQLPWLPIMQGLSLTWHELQPLATAVGVSNSSSTCWRPSIIFSDVTGIEHVVANQSTIPLAEVGPGYTLGHPGDTTWSHWFQLQHGSVLLLRDPRCSYSLQLTWDMLGSVPVILLAHGSAVAGLLMSMLLLVLSHQMAVLIRLVDVARHGGGGISSVHGVPGNSSREEAAGSSRGGSAEEQQRQQQQRRRDGQAGGLRALAAAGAARQNLVEQQQLGGSGWWDLWGLLQVFRSQDEGERALAVARRR